MKKKRVIQCAFILGLIVPVLSINVRKGIIEKKELDKTEFVAHRGYYADTYENTIPGIIEASIKGFDAVEIDVIETKDNVLVLSHYNKIELSNGESNDTVVFHILEEDYSSIQQYVLKNDEAYGEIRFATLENALSELKQRDMIAVLHCKVHTIDFFRRVALAVVNSGMSGNVMYNIDEVNKCWYDSIINIDYNAQFHVPYEVASTMDDGILNKNRIITTIEMAQVKVFPIDDLIKDSTVYIWGVGAEEIETTYKHKPQYIEFKDGIDISGIDFDEFKNDR